MLALYGARGAVEEGAEARPEPLEGRDYAGPEGVQRDYLLRFPETGIGPEALLDFSH